MPPTDRPQPEFRGELDVRTPAPSLDEWRAAATASLKGRPLEKLVTRTHEGIDVAPLYTSDDLPPPSGYPGLPPFIRGRSPLGASGRGWEVCQRFAALDPAAAAAHMAEAVRRNVGAVWVGFDGSVRLGLDPDHGRAADVAGDGVLAATADDLDRLFDPIHVGRTPVHLDAAGAAPAVAALFVAAGRRHRIDLGVLQGSFGCDPLGALAADGELALGLDRSLALVPGLVRWAASRAPGVRALTMSSLPYHLAGATAVQELALTLATGVEYLRALDAAGVELPAACRQLRIVTGVGRDLFMEVAKLRALRHCWARVVEAAGGDADCQRIPIHAVTSPRTLSVRDPWVNMLRGTVESFAAVVGGADALTVLPFDAAVGEPGGLGRRIAANTHTILREESHLDHVVDPAGGSYYLERLTAELAAAGWKLFQTLESSGGMRAAFRSDDGLGNLLATALERRRAAVATRRDPVTGVSSWPNLAEKPAAATPTDPAPALQAAAADIARRRDAADLSPLLDELAAAAGDDPGDAAWFERAVDAAAAGATLGQLVEALGRGARRNRIVPLPAEREAEPFERLRDASDRWLERRGARPRVFVAAVGPLAEHTARTDFARNLLEAGGFETLTTAGYESADAAVTAFGASGTAAAVISATDERYPELVPALASGLKAAGARAVLLAGRPGEHEAAWREAGVDRFIHLGCDVLDALRWLQAQEGVLS